jgi:hypothetical protein
VNIVANNFLIIDKTVKTDFCFMGLDTASRGTRRKGRIILNDEWGIGNDAVLVPQ